MPPSSPEKPSSVSRLRSTKEAHPTLAAAQQRLAELETRAAELEADQRKYAGRDAIVRGIDEELATLRGERAEVQGLVTYMERKRDQLGRFSELERSAGDELATLVQTVPETTEDRTHQRGRKRAAARTSIVAGEALERFAAPTSSGDGQRGPSLEAQIGEFFAASEAAEAPRVARKPTEVHLDLRQQRKLSNAFADAPVTAFLRSKEFRTMRAEFETLLEQQHAPEAARVFAQVEFARLAALPDQSQRLEQLLALRQFIFWSQSSAKDQLPISDSVLRSIRAPRNQTLSTREQEYLDQALRFQAPQAQENATMRAFDMALRYRIAQSESYDLAHALPSYAVLRLYRSGELTQLLAAPALERIDAEETDPQQRQLLRTQALRGAASLAQSMISMNVAGGYLNMASMEHGRLHQLAHQQGQLSPALREAVEREMQAVMSELVPTMNAVSREGAQRFNAPQAHELLPLKVRVDTRNGNVESTLGTARATALNDVGRVVRAQATRAAELREEAARARAARREDLDRTLEGGEGGQVELSEEQLLADELPANVGLERALTQLRVLLEGAAETARNYGESVQTYAQVQLRVGELVGAAERARQDIRSLRAELGEFGLITRTSKSGRSKERVQRLLKEAEESLTRLCQQARHGSLHGLQFTNDESPEMVQRRVQTLVDASQEKLRAAQRTLVRGVTRFAALYDRYEAVLQERYGKSYSEISQRKQQHTLTDRFPLRNTRLAQAVTDAERELRQVAA